MPKRIFMAGAPGSKWSSVAKNIYYSPSIDRSDYSDFRTYYHSAWGKPELMHLGAYFDPGMEFGDWFDNLSNHTKEECEAEFEVIHDSVNEPEYCPFCSSKLTKKEDYEEEYEDEDQDQDEWD